MQLLKGLSIVALRAQRDRAKVGTRVCPHCRLRCLTARAAQVSFRSVEVQTDPIEIAVTAAPHVPPPEAPVYKERGGKIPRELRKLMVSFPKNARIMSRRGLMKLVLQLYIDKSMADNAADEARRPRFLYVHAILAVPPATHGFTAGRAE